MATENVNKKDTNIDKKIDNVLTYLESAQSRLGGAPKHNRRSAKGPCRSRTCIVRRSVSGVTAAPNRSWRDEVRRCTHSIVCFLPAVSLKYADDFFTQRRP